LIGGGPISVCILIGLQPAQPFVNRVLDFIAEGDVGRVRPGWGRAAPRARGQKQESGAGRKANVMFQ